MKVGIDSVLLGAWTRLSQEKHILDLGTGTGILALMMAQRTNAKVDAVEINRQAFLQAEDNIKNSIFDNNIKCYNSSIQDFTSPYLYDLIISNPPYFEDSLKAKSHARSTARHTDTLSFEELLETSSALLTKNGKIALILPFSSLNKISLIAQQLKLHIARTTEVRGKEHKAPNRILIMLQKEETVASNDSLVIYNSEGRYTEEFKSLTQNFYLPSIFR